MIFLEDDRIRLRAVEPEDSSHICMIENDSRQWRENGMMGPYSMHNIRHYAETYDPDPIRCGQIRMVIEVKEETDNSRIAGLIDLYDISPSGRTAFVGVYVSDEFRGKGIAARALAKMEEYACMLLNLRILASKVSEKNSESINLFEKAGYEKAGELPGWLMSGKETFSLLIYLKNLDCL